MRCSGNRDLISRDRVLRKERQNPGRCIHGQVALKEGQHNDLQSLRNILDPAVCLVGLRVNAAQGPNSAGRVRCFTHAERIHRPLLVSSCFVTLTCRWRPHVGRRPVWISKHGCVCTMSSHCRAVVCATAQSGDKRLSGNSAFTPVLPSGTSHPL